MSQSSGLPIYRVAALSVVKHAYLPRGVVGHPRFKLVVVADDASQPEWVHERNELFAQEYGVPYLRDVARAITEFDIQVAVVSSEPERHADLSIRAADAGCHVIQDKPMSTRMAECNRLVQAVERNHVKFMMWSRNFLPAVIEAHRSIERGDIGDPYAFHVDFFFAKDAGPQKGSRKPGDPPMDWLEALKAAHADGSDGGVGTEAMGELQVEGCYPLAYIAMLSAASVRRVYARTASHFHQLHTDNKVDDMATVTLEMDNGIIASICLGRIGAASHPDIGEIKLHILGSQGALVISEARPEVSIYYRNQPPHEFRNQRLIDTENDFLLAENFAQALDTDGDTILDVRGSRAIAATTHGAIESASSGRCVELS